SQPVNLMALAASVLDAVRPQAAEKGVHLYTLVSDEAARVTGDPGMLQQLVWELCVNAISVTPQGGRIALRLERAGNMSRMVNWHVEHASQGHGMVFTIDLPLRAVAQPGSDTTDVAADALRGMEVLLVEDQVAARALIAEVLRDHGARVVD